MKHLLVFICICVCSLSLFAQRTIQYDIKKSHEEQFSTQNRKPDRSFIPPMYSSPTPFRIIKVNQFPSEAPQNEPSVRVNPKNPDNIVVAYRDFRLGWEPAIRNVSIATTTDGGNSWIEQFAQYITLDLMFTISYIFTNW